jgi:hypothetical protein
MPEGAGFTPPAERLMSQAFPSSKWRGQPMEFFGAHRNRGSPIFAT